MAMMAPTGTATSPANSSDNSQGRPNEVVKCAMAAAPTAAKAYWHSETCPAWRIRRPSERNRMTSTTEAEYTGMLSPAKAGTQQSSTKKSPPQSSRTRHGAYHDSDHDFDGTNRRRASLARGVTIKAMNKMMKGSDAGRPASAGVAVTYLVVIAAPTPMIRPPA